MTRPRDEIELDLAFAVNGTLSAADQAEVEEWLAKDDTLRAEFDALAALRAEMQAEHVAAPGEFGLARLLRDVGREASGTTAAAEPPPPNRTWAWQLAAAVAVLALLAQTAYQRQSGTPDSGGYQLASAAPTADLVVSFVPEATEAQIRDLLVGLDLEIVAGPSALGFYQLDVRDGGDETAAQAGLRAAVGIVESIEDDQH